MKPESKTVPNPSCPEPTASKPTPLGKPGADVAVVCGVSADGQGLNILRKRGEQVEAGTVRALKPGKPIHGEVVRLTPRQDSPLVCDVEVEVADSRPSSGPAQVASDLYRKNWDGIFKRATSAPSTTQAMTGRRKANELLN